MEAPRSSRLSRKQAFPQYQVGNFTRTVE